MQWLTIVGSQIRKADAGRGRRRQLDLRCLGGFPDPGQGPCVRTQIDSGLLDELIEKNVRLRSYSDKEPTLEDVFMLVTKGLVS